MTPLRVVIVDDEPLVRRDLARILGAEPDVVIVGEAGNGIEALHQIDDLAPDAVFLDVQMPELDGLGVVAALDPATAPALVFVTAFDQYALQAFDAAAVDYLLKPFDAARCVRALERLRVRIGAPPENGLQQETMALSRSGEAPQYLRRLAVRGTRRVLVIELADVQWIEASDNYVRMHMTSNTQLSRRTMRELETLLDPAQFTRIHRSTIVNVQFVRELVPLGDGDYEVTLKSGERLTLARSYRDTFVSRFGGIA